MKSREWMWIGAASDLGVAVDGAKQGPAAILATPRGKQNQHSVIVNAPEVRKQKEPGNRTRNLAAVLAYQDVLWEEIVKSIHAGWRPLTLGGDHTVAAASALASRNFLDAQGIIWIDAHTDFHVLASTKTGNLHGLPLAVACGQEPRLAPTSCQDFFAPEHAVIVGARSVDPGEWVNLRRAGVKVFTDRQCRQEGLASIMTQAWAIAGERVHVSFDLDVIDPKLAPGVSVPEENGFNLAQIRELLMNLDQNRAKIQSFDLVEYNPARDVEQCTLKIAEEILVAINAD